MKKFILGFITGGIICATATGFAVEYAVTANPFPVAVNGTETAIEGYNINDNTFFKLRDVADAVGGYSVITLLRLILFLFAPNRQTCRQLARLNHCRN